VRWTAHPKDCDDAHTQEVLLRAFEELKERKNTKTGVRSDAYRPLRLTLRKMNGARESGTLRVALVDPAGEYSTDTAHRLSFAGKAIYRQVATSHGLLWLFEATPDGQPSALDRLMILEQLVSLLEAGDREQLELPVALCLSKIDCLAQERRASALEHPTAALLDHLGHTTLTWFEAVCPTLACFAISSAGNASGKVRPVGLNDVLDWFEQQRTRRVRAVQAHVWRGKIASMVRTAAGRLGRSATVLLIAMGVVVAGLGAWKSFAGRADRAPGNGAREVAGDVVPPPAPPNEREDRDDMTRSFQEALARRDVGEPSRALFRRAQAAATRLIDRGPAGSRGLIPLRYVRARSCILGDRGCAASEVREDLTWVLASGTAAERRDAVRMLAQIDNGSPESR
jgi:hypothetical protein